MILLEAKLVSKVGSIIEAGSLLLCNHSSYDAVYIQDAKENKLTKDYVFLKTENEAKLFKKVGNLDFGTPATPIALLREIVPAIGTMVHYDTVYITYNSQPAHWTGFPETKGPDSHMA